MDSIIAQPWKHQSSHLLNQIMSDINTGVQTRSKLKTFCVFYDFLSKNEPKNVHKALANSDWVTAMKEELRNLREIRFGILYHDLRIDQ